MSFFWYNLYGGYMTYLFYGKEKYLIDEEIKKYKSKYDDINIVDITYNNNLDKIIDEANSISLFADNKLIIVSDTTIFNRKKKTEDEENTKDNDNLDILIDYLNHQNDQVDLIFINNQETIDNTKKITKLIKDKGVIKEFNNLNIKETIKSLFGKYKISYDLIDLLINRVGNDISVLKEEIDKIITYKDKDLEINKDDILALTYLNIDVSAFNFADQIINKNKNEALKIYNELLEMHSDPSTVIALLASKVRLIYGVLELRHLGYSMYQMCDTLESKEYPIKLALQAASKTTKEEIINVLNDLADLDINIKTGKINPNLGMQLFILKI